MHTAQKNDVETPRTSQHAAGDAYTSAPDKQQPVESSSTWRIIQAHCSGFVGIVKSKLRPAKARARLAIATLAICLLVGGITSHYIYFAINYTKLTKIGCYSAANGQIMDNGLAVDYCFSFLGQAGTGCGAGAALAFCQVLGAAMPVTWQPESTTNATYAIGSASVQPAVAAGGSPNTMLGYVCCDHYGFAPTPAKWVTYVGGIFGIYLAALVLSRLVRLVVEVLVVGLLSAAEVVWFFIGVDGVLHFLFMFIGWLVWTQQCFW